jgi:hypothetical protein
VQIQVSHAATTRAINQSAAGCTPLFEASATPAESNQLSGREII